jgi:enoyl-[acyl-carrier-protein] reductase (NADH)
MSALDSPLQHGVTLDELGGATVYLLSDLSTGVTGAHTQQKRRPRG